MLHERRSLVSTTLVVVFYLTIILAPISCSRVERNKSHPEVSNAEINRGKALAITYCQSCHAFPDPKLLDAKTWEKGVLPSMGPRLGIFQFGFESYPSSRSDKSLPRGFYPEHPVINLSAWQSIINYYIATSPDTLLADQNRGRIQNFLPTFKVIVPPVHFDNPATSFVKFSEVSGSNFLLVADAIKQKLFKIDPRLQVVDSIKSRGPIVDVEVKETNWLTSNIGILNPNNGKFGSGRSIHINALNKIIAEDKPLFDSLARPVQITSLDVNNDGKPDYIVCEFGYLTGALSWMENIGNNSYTKHVLRPLPGAIKAYTSDYNKDGLPDLWVLFAQGEEGIFLYTNKGHGEFSEREVLGFPPVNGSSFFELIDYNKDGYPDIVYTCGDNADFSTILKPYHGVYIYLNDGKNNFTQSYFYHINGCYKALARDYDNDGDIDIATISFFADYINHPDEGFIYLQNNGKNRFSPYSFPEAKSGRWLTMDAGDLNKDGNTDLILGNFSISPTAIKSHFDWSKGPPFLILQNLGKK